MFERSDEIINAAQGRRERLLSGLDECRRKLADIEKAISLAIDSGDAGKLPKLTSEKIVLAAKIERYEAQAQMPILSADEAQNAAQVAQEDVAAQGAKLAAVLADAMPAVQDAIEQLIRLEVAAGHMENAIDRMAPKNARTISIDCIPFTPRSLIQKTRWADVAATYKNFAAEHSVQDPAADVSEEA